MKRLIWDTCYECIIKCDSLVIKIFSRVTDGVRGSVLTWAKLIQCFIDWSYPVGVNPDIDPVRWGSEVLGMIF